MFLYYILCIFCEKVKVHVFKTMLNKLLLNEMGATESTENKSEKKDSKKEVRALYLMEKYGTRWREKMWKTPPIHLKLTQTTWLQQAMFTPSSRSARQMACSIIESISQIPSRKKEIIDMLTK